MVLESAILNFIKKHISPRLILVEFFFVLFGINIKCLEQKFACYRKCPGPCHFLLDYISLPQNCQMLLPSLKWLDHTINIDCHKSHTDHNIN